MRIIRRISAVIIGFVFFIAGLLKLMDPVGAALVVEEYLRFFHLPFLQFASSFLGAFLALVESITGAALITGVWKKFTAIVSGILLAAFTVIVALLMIFKANFDCGCFGELVHLTQLQSLIKNLALAALWALSFIPFSAAEPTRKIKYVSFSIASISVCFFLLYSALSVPLMDFTPFKPGAELMEEETILSFCDAEGEYADSLAMQDKLLVVSIYSPDKVKEAQFERISALMNRSSERGLQSIVLVASTPEDFEAPDNIKHLSYYADRKTLMTLNRANGGASYLSEGQVIAKWGAAKLPRSEKIDELMTLDSTEALLSENGGNSLKLQGFLLYVFAIMLLL